MQQEPRKMEPQRELSSSAAIPQQNQPPPPAEAGPHAMEELSAAAPRAVETELRASGLQVDRGGVSKVTEQETVIEDDPELEPVTEDSVTDEEFSDKQLRALEALARGESISAAARAGDVHRATIYRWLGDAGFREERARQMHELQIQRRASVDALGDLAVEALKDLVQNASSDRDRVAAIKVACKISGLEPS